MLETHNRSFGLDLVRALAITFVIVAHFARFFDPLGYWGVELFFGLSGFLIGQILWRNFSGTDNWTLKHMFNFWSRRWWRTLPNYYLFFVVSLVFYAYVDGSLPSISSLLRFVFFGQYLLNHEWGFYGISWSLCIEEWFYLSFPLLLFTLRKTGLKPSTSFSISIALFFIASVFLRKFLISIGQQESLRTITFARLDSITCGVTVAYINTVLKPALTVKRAGFVIGIVLLLTPLAVVAVTGTPFERLYNNSVLLFLLPLGASLILPFVSLLNSSSIMYGYLSKVVEKISLWSYSIYLSHIPLMWSIYYLLDGFRANPYGNLISKVVALAITVTASALIFKYWETPITRFRPKELKS